MGNQTFIPASWAEMILFTDEAYNDSVEKTVFVLLPKFTLNLITFISYLALNTCIDPCYFTIQSNRREKNAKVHVHAISTRKF